ncbi:membrane-anchored lipid-binding protein Sip3p [Monosporozyma unispora]
MPQKNKTVNLPRSGPSQKNKQLKLISVEFKEASVDSPAFRAHVNFFHTRIEMFDDRLQTTIDFYDQKFKSSFEDFQRVGETIVSLAFPSPVILANGLVSNQTYTPSVISEFNKEYKNYFDNLIKIVIGAGNSRSDILVELMSNVIEPYKNKRKTFEYFQSKYDNMLNAFQEIKVSNKLADPVSIKNDAQQLHEIRKNYLMASLDLIESISHVKLNLEKYLIDSMSTITSKSQMSLNEKSPVMGILPSDSKYFNDYLKWVQNAIEGSDALKNDMKHAKKQVYEYATNYFTPSQDVKDYNITNIHNAAEVCKNLPIPTSCPEKSGWLHMKTTVGKDNREVWVRRWCFLQNGVFGMFLLSPSKIYVEETDKFGVFLTQVRHDMEENRKYCFEIKVINGGNLVNGTTPAHTSNNNGKRNISIVLQTESLKDLKSWLNAFEQSRRYIETLDSNILAHEVAYKRFSPRFFEFASSTTTSVDQAITTFDSETKSLLDELNCSFSEYEVLGLPDGKLFEFHMDITPISTKLSQLAILSNYFTRGSWFPNGILVNIWGTTNWSEYSLNDSKHMRSSTVANKVHNRLSTVNSEVFPTFYDKQLQIDDLQMKNMVYIIDQRLLKMKEEFLLFKFNSFWYPNARQRFPSICYVTKNHLFCYMNTMGFICLTKVNTADIISVEIDKAHSNRIIIYDVENIQYKVDILFSDRKAVVLKLQTLVECNASRNVSSLEDLHKRFVTIDQQIQDSVEDEMLLKEKNKTNEIFWNNKRHEDQSLDQEIATQGNKLFYDEDFAHIEEFKGSELVETTTFWKMGNAVGLLSRLRNLRKNATVMYKHDYDIPSKGLIHILFGDTSTAFPRCFFLASSNTNQSDVTFWEQQTERDKDTEEPMLTRHLKFPVDMTHYLLKRRTKFNQETIKYNTVSVQQSFIKAIENIYYEVKQGPTYIKLPMCNYLRMSVTYCISQTFTPKDHLATRLRMATSGSVIEMFYTFEFINKHTGEVIPDEKTTYLDKVFKSWAIFFSHVEFLLVRKVIRYYLERIGNHGKVIKAMKFCGLIGVNVKPDEDDIDNIIEEENEEIEDETKSGKKVGNAIPEEYLVRYSNTILLKVFLKLVMYRIVNTLLFVVRFGITLAIATKKICANLNKVILVGLFLSILMNLFLTGRSTQSYWAVKRAQKTFTSYMDQSHEAQEEIMANRKQAIYLSDLEALTQNLALEKDNLAYQGFQKQVSDTSIMNKFKETRDDVAKRRNELLVELKILQNMEREVIQGDYRKFLLEETSQCDKIRREMEDFYEKDVGLQAYCDSCQSELDRLSELLL